MGNTQNNSQHSDSTPYSYDSIPSLTLEGITLQSKKKLKKKIQPNKSISMGMNLLHLACEMGSEEMVRLLLAIGGDPNSVTDPLYSSCPAIVFAAANGHTGCLKQLLAAGARCDVTDCWGNSALFKAACYNHVSCVEVLLAHGAEPKLSNCWGGLPLQYATRQGNTEVVNALLQHGADLNQMGEVKDPHTLTIAAMKGHVDCLKLLVEAGAEVNVCKDGNGETALYYAIKYFFYHTWDTPISNSSSVTTQNFVECVRSLLDSGAEVTLACIRTLCDEHPPVCSREYIILLHTVLQATVYKVDFHQSLSEMVRYLPKLGCASFKLINLVCSIGFMPSETDLEELKSRLLPEEHERLQEFCSRPRSLRDMCRLTIRHHLNGNVSTSVNYLQLPKPLTDCVVLAHAAHYSA